MSKKVRIGVIGCGFIGAYHARAALACEDAELVAAATRSTASLRRFQEQFDVPFATTRLEELAALPDLDAVAIGTPNYLHAPQSIQMLRAGKHVLLEKPMAMNAAEGKRILAAAERTRRVLQIGHNWRYDREVAYLEAVIRKGTLGKIVKAKAYGIHELWGPAGWFARKKQAGGGALIDMGVHAIDTVSCLLGDPAPLTVYARMGTYYGRYDVDDTGIIVIEWEGGTVSIIESGWWQPHMDGPEAAVQVFGTRGYGRIFPTELKLSVGPATGRYVPDMAPRLDHCEQAMYDRQMAGFVSAILAGGKGRPDGVHGLRIMKILDACYRAAASGKVLKIS